MDEQSTMSDSVHMLYETSSTMRKNDPCYECLITCVKVFFCILWENPDIIAAVRCIIGTFGTVQLNFRKQSYLNTDEKDENISTECHNSTLPSHWLNETLVGKDK